MNEDVKAPSYKSESDDEEWRTFLYNQERMINQQGEMLENEKQMIEELKKVSAPYDKIMRHQEAQIDALQGMVTALDARRAQWEVMTKNQEAMNTGMQTLNTMMGRAIDQLGTSVGKASATVSSLMKVPVAVVVIGASSWAFMYMHEINETTWLVIMGIAVFPWLGDSIQAMMKLVGIRQGSNSGEEKK